MKTWLKLKNDPSLFERYFIKEYIISAARKFFEKRGYHELESPLFAYALPQERYLEPFRTSIKSSGNDKEIYIIPTTETYNKKILAAGLGEHYVISKVARAMEEVGPEHSPEFTMLEWYHLDADYFDLMEDCEKLVRFIKKYVDKRLGKETSLKFVYQGTKISLEGKWKRIDASIALKEYCDINLDDIQETEKFAEILKNRGYNVSFDEDWQTLFEWIFANEIEPELPKNIPVFVYNYPKQICPLTQLNKQNPLVCEKVELYIGGKELANGYTELIDWKEQEKRFLEEREAPNGEKIG